MTYLKVFPCGDSVRKYNKMAFGVRISQADARTSAENAAAKEEFKCLTVQAAGDGEKSDDGGSAVNVESNMDAEAAEATKYGSY